MIYHVDLTSILFYVSDLLHICLASLSFFFSAFSLFQNSYLAIGLLAFY